MSAFSACNSGPNLVVPSRRCWYSGVTPADLDLVADYLRGGPVVERLRQQNDPDVEQLIFDIIDAGLVPDVD
jgi:(2Fe-2S) ferredoxin